MSEQHERLRQTLIENGETLDDLELLAELSYVLDKVPAPEPRRAHLDEMIALLETEMPAAPTLRDRLLEWYPIALLLSQVRIIQREIWGASAFVLTLGVLVTITSPRPDMTLFTALAPMVAAVGVAMLYDENIKLILELEETTRASARLLLLARLTLIFGFNLLISTAASIVLVLINPELSLAPLIMSWLAPMSFLSALAFFLGVLIADPAAASLFSLVLWVIHKTIGSDPPPGRMAYLLSMPAFSDPAYRPVMMLMAALMTLLALWIVGTRERMIGTDQ